MKKSGGRETGSSPVHHESLPELAKRGSSSSTPDRTDEKILTLATDHPVTLLNISKRVDIPFVEGLRRVRWLEDVGLLKKVGDVSEPATLHLYLTTRQRV